MFTYSWIRNLFARGPRTVRKAQPRFRRGVEGLEERVTPTTYSITNLLDNFNPGSLRYAILQANANPGPDTINLYEVSGGVMIVPHPGTINLAAAQLPTITGD